MQACNAAGGHCVTYLDGYYAEMVLCVVIEMVLCVVFEMILCVVFGVIWAWWQRNRIGMLQSLIFITN